MSNRTFLGKKLIADKVVETIKKHLEFHGETEKLYSLETILNKRYDFSVANNFRGNSMLFSPYESFRDDMVYYLNRTEFLYVDEEAGIIDFAFLSSDLDLFVYISKPLIHIKDKNISIHGYEYEEGLHVLRIKAESFGICNFKRIKKLLDKLKEKYPKLSATCAKSACNYIGKDQKWRFKTLSGTETRLKHYWKKLGWNFIDSYKMQY